MHKSNDEFNQLVYLRTQGMDYNCILLISGDSSITLKAISLYPSTQEYKFTLSQPYSYYKTEIKEENA